MAHMFYGFEAVWLSNGYLLLYMTDTFDKAELNLTTL